MPTSKAAAAAATPFPLAGLEVVPIPAPAEVPGIPEMPGLPALHPCRPCVLPALSVTPGIPDIPDMPAVPYIPDIPDMPFIPDTVFIPPLPLELPGMPQPLTQMSRQPATRSNTKMLTAVGMFGMAPCAKWTCVKWTT